MKTAHVATAARPAITSTVGALSDRELLRETSNLVRHERHLQGAIIDHLAEIEARGLYLQRGFSSLFDYAVRELGYSDAAAARRIGVMRLCADQPDAREGLRDGSLTLSAAAELQWAFDRQRRRGSISRAAAIAPVGSAAQNDPAPDSAPAVPSSAEPEPPPLVLDAVGRQKLVEEAAGKSARQVRQMLADLDPELAPPADRVRPLGDGRYELKAVIDADCQQGLEQLRGLLSHVDPRMTIGLLVGRLVKEGLDRHDPSRPPRRARSGSRPADAKANTPRTPTSEQAQRNSAPAAKHAARPAIPAGAAPTPARAVRPMPTSVPPPSTQEETARRAATGAKPTSAATPASKSCASGRATAASPKGAPRSVSRTRNPEDPRRNSGTGSHPAGAARFHRHPARAQPYPDQPQPVPLLRQGHLHRHPQAGRGVPHLSGAGILGRDRHRRGPQRRRPRQRLVSERLARLLARRSDTLISCPPRPRTTARLAASPA